MSDWSRYKSAFKSAGGGSGGKFINLKDDESVTFFLPVQTPGMEESYWKGGVKVDHIVDDPAPVRRVLDPSNPLADDQGYVFQSNVSEVTEMVEMMAAARSYQNNVEVINTARQLMMRTLEVVRG